MTTRIDARFAALKKEGRSAFITFVMAGDPDPATSLDIIKALPKAGSDIIEIGMPFTDPMADGPAIQAAGLRALKAGMTLKKTLAMVREFRKDDNATPLVLMGYYNPIYIYGVDKFLVDAKSAGVDGLIIVDLPPEEDTELCLQAMKAGLNFIRVGLAATAVSLWGLAAVGSFWPFLAVFWAFGLGLQLFRLSLDTLLFKEDHEDAPRRMGQYNAMRMGGMMVGALLGGAGYYWLDFPATLRLFCVGALLLIAPTVKLPLTRGVRTTLFDYGRDFLAPPVLFFAAWLFLFTLHWGAEATSLSLFLEHNLNLSPLDAPSSGSSTSIFCRARAPPCPGSRARASRSRTSRSSTRMRLPSATL